MSGAGGLNGKVAVLIRQSAANEHETVKALVQAVGDETYGGLWCAPPLPVDDEDWSLAWVAGVEGCIAGMVLTNAEWLSDLWVLKQHRGRGVGGRLLCQAEAEIRNRGLRMMRLRVVRSNVQAISFYQEHGWRVERAFRHETFPIEMVEMSKASERTGDPR